MTEEQINSVLQEIQKSVPPLWHKLLFRRVEKTPTAKFVVKKALKDPGLSPEKRAEFEALLRSGELSETMEVVDERMAKRIDNYVGRKIERAIKLGQLPSREELEKLPFFKKYAQETPDQKAGTPGNAGSEPVREV